MSTYGGSHKLADWMAAQMLGVSHSGSKSSTLGDTSPQLGAWQTCSNLGDSEWNCPVVQTRQSGVRPCVCLSNKPPDDDEAGFRASFWKAPALEQGSLTQASPARRRRFKFPTFLRESKPHAFCVTAVTEWSPRPPNFHLSWHPQGRIWILR